MGGVLFIPLSIILLQFITIIYWESLALRRPSSCSSARRWCCTSGGRIDIYVEDSFVMFPLNHLIGHR